MLYTQPEPWATLLKQDMAAAILRGWRAEGKAEAAVECSLLEKSWGLRQSRRHHARSSRSLQCQRV